MNGMLIPILVACAVACLVWGVSALVGGAGAGERRKLQQRLSEARDGQSGGLGGGSGGLAKSIVVQSSVKGIPEALARQPFIQALNRRLQQGYPDSSLGKFLSIALGIAVSFGGLSLLISTSTVVGVLAAAAG